MPLLVLTKRVDDRLWILGYGAVGTQEVSIDVREKCVMAENPLTVRKIYRKEAGDVDLGQPRVWTFIEFEAADKEADSLAAGLSAALEPKLGWYCDFRSEAA